MVSIPSAALGKMSKVERDRFLKATASVSSKDRKAYILSLDAFLRVFEHRYEMPSSELSVALKKGRLRDTAEVSKWMFWATLRSDLARKTRTKPAK